MAINPNNGVLDIVNGVLKVSSIDIKESGGFATAINTVARNDVLLYDDQHTNTTFLPAEGTDYRSTAGVSRDTYSIDFNDGWVYWPLKLPNSWHAQFDMRITATGGVFTFSLFNTSTPNHTDYTANDGGYKIVFDNTNNQIDVYWEGSVHATVSANVRSTDWQHVNINYFRGGVSVSLAGKVVLNHGFTENYQEVDSRYVGFSATSGTSHEIRNLAVHNSDKWLYTKTSNASDITYVSGNVGIGTLTPTELLDVHGNVHVAKNLTVNGNLTVSGTTTFIDTQNLAIEDPIIEVARGNASDTIDAGLVITRATSNVAVAYRGDEEELALGYTQSGASDTDVTPIADGGLDVRVYGNLFANNLTTTANVEATYLKGDGSEITQVTLDQVVGYGNVTSNTIQLAGLTATGNVEANYFIGNGSKLTGLVTDLQSVTDNGNVTSNTVQFTNATTAFVADSNVGIGTDTPAANLHVMGYQYVNGPPTLANAFDHSDAPLTLTHGTPTSTTAVDDPKAVLHLTRDGTDGESYGSKASFKMSRYENSGTASRSRLDVALTDGTYTESTVMTLRADGKVGIGTTAPGYTLDVRGTSNVGALTATSLSGDGSGLTSLDAGNISSGTIDKDRLPTTLNNTTIGSLAVGTDDVTLTGKQNYHGLKIIKAFDHPDEPATLLLAGDGDTGDDIAFEIRGNGTGADVDTTTTRDSDDTTFGILHTGHTYIGYPNLNPGETGGNAQNGDPMLNVSGDIYATGNVGIGTASPGYKLDVHGTSNVGALTATSLSGDGSGLTSLDADNLSSGTVSSDRLSLIASDIPSLDAGKITSGTLTRPINTTTGTFSGRVDSDRYLTSNTFSLPDPNQHSFRHVCMITQSSTQYGLTQSGGCIYEYNPLTGDTIRVVAPVSEPTAGTFTATAGREYFPMGSPMTMVNVQKTVPFTNLGSLFGFVESRLDATTAYLYAPYSNVSVEYFHNTSVTGTPTDTIVVPSKTVTTFTCTSDSNAGDPDSHVFVAKGGRILMSSIANGGDSRVLSPLSTIAYGYYNTTANDIYLENDVTTSGKCVYSNTNIPVIVSQDGDGDGSDATCGIPFELVADSYIVPHDIRGWMIQFLYTETVVNVAYWSATNSQWERYGSYEPTGTPSILSPEELKIGKMGASGIDIGTTHTLWMFTGTKDFTLTVEEYLENERTVSGFRTHQVAQQIQTNLLDNVVQDSSGNVGIGTNNPLVPLQVRGSNAKFAITDSSEDDCDTNAFNAAIIFADNTWTGSAAYSGNPANGMAFLLGHLSSGSKEITMRNLCGELSFGTRDIYRAMYINNDGNVGIGTTSPQYKLDVDGGTTEGDGDVMLRLMGTAGHTGKLILGRSGNSDIRSHAIEVKNDAGDTNNFMKFLVHDGGSSSPYETRTEVMTLLGNGNVGIGTTSPVYKLDVHGTANVGALTTTSVSGDGSGLTSLNASNVNTGTFDAAKISSGTVADDTGGVKAVYFDNTEQSGYYTDKSGILAFDENFYDDTEYGTGTYDPDSTFVGGNGGGLLIKNEDGWGAIFTSQNTRWAKGYWNALDITNTVTATSYRLTGDATPYKQSIKNDTNLAVGWYRIAENGNAADTASNGSRCSARFTIIDYDSGLHSTRTLYAGGTYGNKPFIHLLTNTSYGGDGNISKVRVVEGSTYEGLAVEIYVDTACSTNEIRIVMDDNYQVSGFTMVNFESVVANHSNMNEYELNLNTTFWGMFLDNTTTNICMLESGNVGIGTTSPSDKLHVNGGNLRISAAAGGGVYDNGYKWLECDNDTSWGRLAQTARTNGIACYNGIAINDNGGLVVGSWDSPNALGVGNGKFTGDLTVSGKIYNYNYTEVDINAPATTSGSWTTANSSSWGDPKFNNTYDRYRYNDAPGYVEYTIPTGMKSAYLSQLQWNNGGYVDIHGVQADGDLIFLRRINTRQAVENSNHANPDQHDGSTITFVGSGLQYFTKIRLTNKKGRFHLTGLAFTPNENEGTEGTGMVHTAQISDLSGHPVQYVGQNVHDIVVYGNSVGRYITPLDITITPKFSNSKIMLHWVINSEGYENQVFRVYRGSTLIGYNTITSNRWSGVASLHWDNDHASTMNTNTVVWVDTPNTTSAVTYRVYCQTSTSSNQWITLNKTRNGASTGQNAYEVAVSYKSAMEIAV